MEGGEENPACSGSRQRLATHGVPGTGMPRASYAGASVHLALAACGVNWGIPEAAQLSQMWPCCVLLHQEPVGTHWELGEGWARGRVNWCSLLLCAHTHTHTCCFGTFSCNAIGFGL